MNLPLNIRVFIWWDRNDPTLNPLAREMIADPQNAVFVSAALIWEIAIKRRLDKLIFSGSPTAAISANGLLELAILPADAETADSLDWEHNDPFDRVPVSQAIRRAATLLTAERIRDYASVPQH